MADIQETVQAAEQQQVVTKTHDLVVVHPFGKYRRGDAITDDAEIHQVLTGESAHQVRRVFVAQ
jgi:hypothetical protein